MNSTTLPAAVEFAEQSLSIIDRDGTPWLAAADLARALGYKRADAVTRIYERHRDEFTAGMSETVKLTVSGNLRTDTRIFSPRGAHLVAMFAHTERAAAFRRWVLDVLEGLGQPAPAPALQVSPNFASASHRMRAWVKATAGGTQPVPHLSPEQLDGIVADMLFGQRFLVHFDSRLNMRLSHVPTGAVVITPEDLPSLIEDPGSVFRRSHMQPLIEAAVRRLVPQR